MTGSTASSTLTSTLRQVHACLRTQGSDAFLVGGFLRDHLVGRPPRYLNIDLAVPREALALSRALAAELRGAYVPLDEAEGSARVVVTHEGRRLELDISEFRAPDLAGDLRRRDFTINAMAIRLEDWLRDPEHPQGIVDPLNGQRALAERRISPCFPETFEEDPVRILRAFRFAAQFEFAIEPSASPLMARAVSRLAGVSGERLRDELVAICETDRAHPAIRSLNDLGALDVLVPELSAGRGLDQGSFHHLDVLGHQVETVAQADRFLADFAEFSPALRSPLAAYCAEELVERRSRKSLIKLAGLLHDVGKPTSRQVHPDGEIWFLGHEETGAAMTEQIVQRLRFANREGEMICRMVRHHLRPGFLSREPQVSRRAIYRFYKDLGDDGPACLLTWWADRMATRGSKSRLDQIDQQRGRLEELLSAYFFQAEAVVKPPRLVDGHRLMEVFRLPPGPLIGELLDAIEEAQAEGRIQTADEAVALARTCLERTRG